VAMFRDRRSGIRRVYQLAELIPPSGSKKNLTTRILYKWNPRGDKIEKFQSSRRLINKLQMYTGLSSSAIEKELKDKQKILLWMVKNKVNTVDGVGRVIAEYYRDPKRVLSLISKNEKAEKLIPKKG